MISVWNCEDMRTYLAVLVNNEQRKLRKAQRHQEKVKIKEQEQWLKAQSWEAQALAVEAEQEEKRELKRVVAEKKKEEKERRRKEVRSILRSLLNTYPTVKIIPLPPRW